MLTVRDFQLSDLTDLDWSGGPAHQAAVAAAVQASLVGDVALVAAALPNGRLVAMGAVDFRPRDDAGEIWMLSVDEAWQSMGLGSSLVDALESRVRGRGRSVATLGVELDNPRAAALYRRLGYRQTGSALDSWPLDDGTTYVTVVRVMERRLAAADHHRPGPAQ